MRSTQRNLWLRLTAVPVISGILLVLLLHWLHAPAASLALPPAARLQAVWRQAAAASAYQFTTDLQQTTYPAATLANVGRSSRVEQLYLDGTVNRRDQSVSLRVQADGRFQDAAHQIELQMTPDGAQMRAPGGEWEPVDANGGLFAPGNDPLALLAAAQNVAAAGQETRAGVTFDRFTFDVSGPALAQLMRQQLEQQLRAAGKLPPGLSLDDAHTYRDAVGAGELWVRANGRPLRLHLLLRYPPAADGEQMEARLVTDFYDFEERTAVSWANGVADRLPSAQAAAAAAQLAVAALMLGGLWWAARRRTQVGYTAVVLLMIVSMVVGPFLQTQQAAAFYEKMAAEAPPETAAAAETAVFPPALADTWDPHLPPLSQPPIPTAVRLAPTGQPLAGAPALQTPPDDDPDADGDGLTASQEAAVCRVDPEDADAAQCLSDDGQDLDGDGQPDGWDFDGDGLADGWELLRLGTDPFSPDSDQDTLTDLQEVEGVRAPNGRLVYSDPLQADSNGDGLLDSQECCDDADGDGLLDFMDPDNDGDGVPDAIDLSPATVVDDDGAAFGRQRPFQFQVNDLQPNTPIFVDMQLRPTNPQRLTYALNVLDWPSNDTTGQITRTLDTTFPGADGDLRLIPMLEIRVKVNVANDQFGALPTNPDALSNPLAPKCEDENPNPNPDACPPAWLAMEKIKPYGISVKPLDDNTLLLYAPLSVVSDDTGGGRVAFRVRIPYELTGSAQWGEAHDMRVVWLLQLLQDDGSERIIQTYYDDWRLTGLSVREDHGLQVAVAFENAQPDDDVPTEDNLWTLANGLQDTFVTGRSGDGAARDVTVATMAQRFDSAQNQDADVAARWGLPPDAFQVLTHTLPHQDQIAQFVMTRTTEILNTHFGTAVTANPDLTPTLLFAREETFRDINVDEGGAISGPLLTLSAAESELLTTAVLNWAPYRYEDGAWENMPIDQYWDQLDVMLRQLDDFQLNPDQPDDDLRVDGQVRVAQALYLQLFRGAQGVVQVSGRPITPTLSLPSDVELESTAAAGVTSAAGGAIAGIVGNIAEKAFDAADELQESRRLLAALPFDETEELSVADRFFTSVGKGIRGQGQEYVGLSPDSSVAKNRYDRAKTVAVLATITLSIYAASGGPGANTVARVYEGIDLLLKVDDLVAAYKATAEKASVVNKIKAGVVALVIGELVNWGVFIGLAVDAGLTFAGLAFNNLLADTIAATITAVIMLLILAIPVVGQIIAAVVAIIDGIIALACGLAGADKDENVICYGITGAVKELIKWAIYNQTVMVALQPDDDAGYQRLDIEGIDLQPLDAELGIVDNNALIATVTISNEIDLVDVPFDWKAAAYWWQYSDGNLKSSTFAYELTTDGSRENHESLVRDTMAGEWAVAGDRFAVDKNIVSTGGHIPIGQAGLNRTLTMYLVEGFNVPAQECWVIPPTPYTLFIPIPVCTIRDFAESSQQDLGQNIIFDVLPGTLDGFYTLTAKDGGHSLAWGQEGAVTFSRFRDADGDGLLNRADGGSDPNDAAWDTDSDGLSDFFETQAGTNPAQSDVDGDALSDASELRLGTDPNRRDTDGDGLPDGDEVRGWLIAYGFDGSGATLRTQITSDPLAADADGDGLTDFQEQLYGFNPNVYSLADVLTIDPLVYEAYAPRLLLDGGAFTNTLSLQDGAGFTAQAACDAAANRCPAHTVNGRFYSGFRFDGINDAITATLPVTPAAIFPGVSLSAWVSPSVTTVATGTIFALQPTTNTAHLLQFDGGSGRFAYSDGAHTVTSTAVFTDTGWVHTLLTLYPMTGTLALNGQETAVFTHTLPLDGALTIGSGPNGADPFAGSLDEILAFDYVLNGMQQQLVRDGRYNPNDLFVTNGDLLVAEAYLENRLLDRYLQGLLYTYFLDIYESEPDTFTLLPDRPNAPNSLTLSRTLAIEQVGSGPLPLTQLIHTSVDNPWADAGGAALWLPLDGALADQSGNFPPRDAACDGANCPDLLASGAQGGFSARFRRGDTLSVPDAIDWLTPDNQSICLWINPSDVTGNELILAANDFQLAWQENRLEITDGSWFYLLEDTPDIVPGVWSHVCVVFQPQDQVDLYINSVPRNFSYVEEFTFNPPSVVRNHLEMGGTWDGRIDDLRIYPWQLTPAEISDLYRPPVLHFSFDGGEAVSDALIPYQPDTYFNGRRPMIVNQTAVFNRDAYWPVTVDPTLDLSDGDFSIAFWLFPTQNLPYRQGLWGERDRDAIAYPTLEMLGDDLILTMSGQEHPFADVLAFNEWNYVALSYQQDRRDAGNQPVPDLQLFVNGEPRGSVDAASPAAAVGGALEIGRSTNCFSLTLTDLRSYAETNDSSPSDEIAVFLNGALAQLFGGVNVDEASESLKSFTNSALRTYCNQVTIHVEEDDGDVEDESDDNELLSPDQTLRNTDFWENDGLTPTRIEGDDGLIEIWLRRSETSSGSMTVEFLSFRSIKETADGAGDDEIYFLLADNVTPQTFTVDDEDYVRFPNLRRLARFEGVAAGAAPINFNLGPLIFPNGGYLLIFEDDGDAYNLVVDGLQALDTDDDPLGSYNLADLPVNPRSRILTFSGDGGAVGVTVDFANPSVPFTGQIDDFAIYQRPLTPQEIRDQYRHKDVVAQFNLDDLPNSTQFTEQFGGYPAVCTGDSCPIAGDAGVINRAVRFDGDDWLSADAVSRDAANSLALSFSAWALPSTAAQDGALLAFDNAGGSDLLTLHYQNGRFQLRASGQTLAELPGLAETWQQVSVIVNADDSGRLILRDVNGSAQQAAFASAMRPAANGRFTIGASYAGGGVWDSGFQGAIDHVVVKRSTDVDFAAPTLWLHLDEDADSTIFADAARGATVTAEGNPTANEAGVLGTAVQFDGVDDALIAGNAGELGMVDSSFTLVTWVKIGDPAAPSPILASPDSSGIWFGLDYTHPVLTDGAPAFRIGTQYLDSAFPLDPGRWYQVAFRHAAADDTKTAEWTLFVNGQPQSTVTDPQNLIAKSLSPLDLMTIAQDGQGNHFAGWLDEFLIYGSALTDRDVNDLFRLTVNLIDQRNVTAYTVDNDPPTTTLRSDAQYRPNRDVILQLDASDATSPVRMVEVAFNGGAYGGDYQTALRCADAFSDNVYCPRFMPDGEGVYTLTTRAVDSVGNRSAPVTDTLIVDNTPPTAAAMIPAAAVRPQPHPTRAAAWLLPLSGVAADPPITGTVGISGSGVTRVAVQLFAAAGAPLDAGLQTAVLTSDGAWQIDYPLSGADVSGAYTIVVTAVDAVGNASETRLPDPIRLDTTPPQIETAVPLNTSAILTPTSPLQGTVADPGAIFTDVTHVDVALTPIMDGSPFRNQPLPPGTALYLPLDESAANRPTQPAQSAPPDALRFADFSGRDGFARCDLAVCPQEGARGFSGQALAFNGQNQLLTLAPLPISRTLTLAAWVQPQPAANVQTIAAAAGANGRFALQLDGSQLQLVLDDAVLTATLPPADVNGGWRHLAAAVGDGRAALYRNGVEVAAAALPAPDLSGARWTLGAIGERPSRFYHGGLDELLIANRAFTGVELADLLIDRPLLHLPFDQQLLLDGSALQDASRRGGNGRLQTCAELQLTALALPPALAADFDSYTVSLDGEQLWPPPRAVTPAAAAAAETLPPAAERFPLDGPPTPICGGERLALQGPGVITETAVSLTGGASFWRVDGDAGPVMLFYTVTPDANKAAAGQVGSHALAFDGVNDTVTVDHVVDWFVGPDTGLSFGAWAQLDAAAFGPQPLLTFATSAGPLLLLADVRESAVSYALYLDRQPVLEADPLPLGNWQHVFVTIAADNTAVLTIDGQPQATGLVSARPAPTTRMTVGSNFSGPFHGLLDDVRVYKRPLSAAELDALVQQAWQPAELVVENGAVTWAGAVPAGLDGYYRLDVRARDGLGNVAVQQGAENWRGAVDSLPPRAAFTAAQLGSGDTARTVYELTAVDFQLQDVTFRGDCAEVRLEAEMFGSSWFRALTGQPFPVTGQPFTRRGSCTLPGHQPHPVAAELCDLGGCLIVEPAPIDEPPRTTLRQSAAPDVAILAPGPARVLTGDAAFSGGLLLSGGAQTLTVAVNNTPIFSQTWAAPLTQTTWTVPWQPTLPDGPITVTAVLQDAAGGQAVDTAVYRLDTAPPVVRIDTQPITRTRYNPLGQFLLTGAVVDGGGAAAVEVRVNGGSWQQAIITGDRWRAAYTPDALTALPNGDRFAVAVRAVDIAGRTAADDASLLVDVVAPPSPPLRVVQNGRTLAPGSTLRDLPTALTLNWTPAPGVTYLAGWTLETGTELVRDVRVASGGQRPFVIPENEAAIVQFSLTSRDALGNERTQTVGPYYVDAVGAPDVVHDLAYDGWRDPAATRLGRSAEAAAVYGPQLLDAAWDAANLRLSWRGAHWNAAGDLWLYLDTQPGGAASAFNPYDGQTAVSLPPDFGADAVVWLEDERTASIAFWQDGAWTTPAPLPRPLFRIDAGAQPVQTDLLLPFALAGIDPAAALGLLALATEEDSLRVWAAMPPVNPVDSVAATNPLAVGFVGETALALTHAYRWEEGLGTAVLPNAGQLSGDLALSLSAEPTAPAVGYRSSDLLDVLALDPESGLSLTQEVAALPDAPLALEAAGAPLTHTQRVTLTLQYANVGTAVVPDARVLLQDDPHLRFFDAEISLGDVPVGGSGEVAIPAVAIADRNGAATAEPQLAVADGVYGAVEWLWTQFTVQPRPADTTPPTVQLDPALQESLQDGELSVAEFAWSGTTQDNAEVDWVEVCIEDVCEMVTAVPDAPGTGGAWAYTLPLPQTEGARYAVVVTAVDADGNRSDPLTAAFTVYNGPPDVTITAPATARLATYYAPDGETPPLLTGEIAPGGRLEGIIVWVQRIGAAGRWLRADVDGDRWSLTPQLTQPGRYRFRVESRDDRGNVKGFGPVFVTILANETQVTESPYGTGVVTGAFIELRVTPAAAAAWTRLEWQTAGGDWAPVVGWQGTPDASGRVRWYAGPELLGSGPYRWLVYGADERPLAISAPFTLPNQPRRLLQLHVRSP